MLPEDSEPIHPPTANQDVRQLTQRKPRTASRAPRQRTPGSLVVPRAENRPFWRDVLRRRVLALADVGAAFVATASIFAFGGGLDRAFWAFVLLPVWIVLAKVHGLYDNDHRVFRHLTADELPKIMFWGVTSTGVVAVLLALTPAGAAEITEAARMCVIATAAAFVFRALARFLWRRLTPPERAIVAGDGALAAATRRKLELFPDIHICVVDDDVAPAVFDVEQTFNESPDVERVILSAESISEALVAELIAFCRAHRLKLSVVPPPRAIFGAGLHLSHVADLGVLQYQISDVSRSSLLLKRIIDVIGSSIALLVLAPLFAAAAVAIKIDSRGSALFSQLRAGLGGRPYRMYKFRTMVIDAEELLSQLVPFDSLVDPMFKLADDPRTTRVGRILRRWSIDELPQLWNVLKGDMSLVGPRPEQLDLVERYAPEHRFRLEVKPGVTGPMQVFGRGELTFEERLAVERDYVENLSLARDLRILALTIPSVISGKGAF